MTIVQGVNKKGESNQQKIVQLELQEQMEVLSAEVAQLEEDSIEEIYSMKEKGEVVASCQNEFQNLLLVSGDEAKTDQVMDRMKEVFSQGYSAVWYEPSKEVSSQQILGQWSFVSTYEFLGEKPQALWEYKDKNGNVYAYATAIYDRVQEVFMGPESFVTELGYVYKSDDVEKELENYAESCFFYETFGYPKLDAAAGEHPNTSKNEDVGDEKKDDASSDKDEDNKKDDAASKDKDKDSVPDEKAWDEFKREYLGLSKEEWAEYKKKEESKEELYEPDEKAWDEFKAQYLGEQSKKEDDKS